MNKCWLAALLLCVGLATQAQPTNDWNAWNPEKAQALAASGSRERGAQAFVICRGCHRVGALGRPDGSYPRLAGQHATVLIKQMTDVRAGRRTNPKMLPFVDEHELDVQQIADIAAYVQALPVPPTQGQGPGVGLERARQDYAEHCSACHGPTGKGDGAKFYPRVAGQHFKYLLREERMIRDGQRGNGHPRMVDAIAGQSDDDLSALADLMSRFPLD